MRPLGIPILFCLLIAALATAGSADAAIPPAGQVIQSVSTAVYQENGSRKVVSSNEVALSVLAVYEPSLTPDGTVDVPAQVRRGFGGEMVFFPFLLENIGNDADSYRLAVRSLNPSAFVCDSRIFVDVDNDSIVDPGEPEVSSVGPIDVGAGVHLIVASTLPAGLLGGETAHLELNASSTGDSSAVDTNNVVRIVARNEASVSLSLSSSANEVLPGDSFEYAVGFSNPGERSASNVIVSDFIDYGGMSEGTIYRPGSAHASYPGAIEYLDSADMQWVDVEPPAERVIGVRLIAESLPPQAQGALRFSVMVPEDRSRGDLLNAANARYIGAGSQSFELSSNEVTVRVGMVSLVAIGPVGDPMAPRGSDEDRVAVSVNGRDSTYTFWHELYNGGNYTDTIDVFLADSSLVPTDWHVSFVDSNGTLLSARGDFNCAMPPIAQGGSALLGVRFRSSPESFRFFTGRAFALGLLARSRVFPDSSDTVEDLFIKTDMPVVSVKQSIREPTATAGDVLSFMITVTNVTDEMSISNLTVTENLGAGLALAAAEGDYSIKGNVVHWRLGTLAPSEKKNIVFQARVRAGQEWGRISSSAWAYGETGAGDEVSDGPSVASVKIVEGVFTRKGLIFGGVYRDDNGDGIWEEGEVGLAGVIICCEDGTKVTTDTTGYYSLPGMDEGVHVLRIDDSTLPDSLTTGSGGHFSYGTNGGTLVVLAPSGNRRVDFPVVMTETPSSGPLHAGENVSGKGLSEHDGSEPTEEGASKPMEPNEADTGITEKETSVDADRVSENKAKATSSAQPGSKSYEAMIIPNTHFAAGSTELEDIPLSEMASLSLWLRDHPGWTVMVEGYTDSIPVSNAMFPSNLELSIARARSVYQLLLMNGIPQDRIDYTGYGSKNPAATNSTPEGRARNRRVEIRVVPPAGYESGDPHLADLIKNGAGGGAEVHGGSGVIAKDEERGVGEADAAGPEGRESGTGGSKASFVPLSDSTGICTDIVQPEEGHLFTDRDRIDIEVTARLASSVSLYINNVPVGIERIGKKTIDLGDGTISTVFYGVKISEGKNEILVVTKRTGGEKSVCVRHVYLAGRPAACMAEKETIEVPADGKTPGEITFLISDKKGLPVRDGIFADVSGPKRLISGLDRNPDLYGVQVATKDGKIALKLPPQRDPSEGRVTVAINELTASCKVRYVRPAKKWFVIGYGDGSIGYSALSGYSPVHNSGRNYQSGGYVDGKVAFFGTGEILRNHILTCAVNTKPLREDRLFRRIEPDKYYPVLGDASRLAFGTESRSGTFLKLESARYEMQLGDFETRFDRMEFNRYRRKFNGFTGQTDIGERARIKGFVTKTDQITYQEELRGEGTSGFYFVKHYPIVENSEKIRIEVRDRYQTEKIVRVDYKQVFKDYDINYLDGSILFKEPVPAWDENMNPVYIVVSYECRNGSESNFIYGVRSTVNVTDSLVFGVMAVLEEEGVENSSIVGVDLDGSLHRNLSMTGEFTHSEKFLLGGANAYRLKLMGRVDEGPRWSAYFRNVDRNFYNPSFSGGKTELGSKKVGGELEWPISRTFSIHSKAFRHDFAERNEKKFFAGAAAGYKTQLLSGRIGFAGVSHDDIKTGKQSATMMMTSVGVTRDKLKGELQWDEILAGSEVQEYPNRLQMKLTRKLWKDVAASFRHEYRTGRASGTRHLSQFAIEQSRSSGLSAYSRYRLEGAASGERGMAIMGLKEAFSLTSALSGTISMEKQATVSGSATDDFFSVGSACLYTPKDADYKLKGNYEARVEKGRVKHLAGIAGLTRSSRRTACLFKGDLWFDDERVEPNRIKGSWTAAFATRPRSSDRLAVFSLLKGAYEHNSPAHPDAVDKDVLLSIEVNYAFSPDWQVQGKVAGKWAKKTFKEFTNGSSTYLYEGELIRAIGSKWDVRLKGRFVHQIETRSLRFGSGIEIGRVAAEGLWLGVGYDCSGQRDSLTPENEFTSRGLYVRMRYKFTEKILGLFNGIE